MAQLHLPSGRHTLDFSLTLPSGHRQPGTVVIYAHGFVSNQKGEKVTFLRERFNASGCAFLAFDHRGHGASSGTMKELTVSNNLEDLDAILTSHGSRFKNRIVIGSSMGGQTAAWYAARHPEQVTANLLIAPGFRFLQNRKKDLGPEGLKQLEEEGQVTIRNEWVEVTIGKSLLEDAARYPVEQLLLDYRTPTLIIHGTEDESVPFEDSVSFTKISKARPLELVLIAGGDHRLSDHKETLFQEMRGFCDRLGLLP